MHRPSSAALPRRFACAAVLLLLAGAAPALAGPTEDPRLLGTSACDDEGVLSRIRHRFAYGAARVEKRDLGIVGIDRVRQIRAEVDKPSPIARRWCSARVMLSDGTRSTLHWVVAGGVGFAGPGLGWIPDDVDFCVTGHDRWRVHDGACRTTRRWW